MSKGKIVVEEEWVRDVWTAYYEKLLNEEFDWSRNDLIDADVVSGPLEEISMQEVRSAIHKMKSDKSSGPTGLRSRSRNAESLRRKWGKMDDRPAKCSD